MSPINDLGSFLAHAVVLEDEAAERYDELAEAMQTHRNPEVAELFAKMAGYSRLHRAEAVEHASRHAGGLPSLKPWEFHWPETDSPESAAFDQAHYLMTPHHALSLALVAEHKARDFYSAIATETESAVIRALAAEFAAEEGEHVEALERWITRFPAPPPGWDLDHDPPAAVD